MEEAWLLVEEVWLLVEDCRTEDSYLVALGHPRTSLQGLEVVQETIRRCTELL